MGRSHTISAQDPDFWAPRSCLLKPVPEIFTATELLDKAVDAHLAGAHGKAGQLIAEADMPEVREWVESLWGKTTPEIHRVRAVVGVPPKLNRNDLDPKRNADREQKRALIERDGYRCRFCGIPVVRKEIRTALRRHYGSELPWGRRNSEQHAAFQCLWLQFDHVLPHSRGRRTDLDNLVVTCAPCNFGRAEWTLEEVGLIDPRSRPIRQTNWDGLERPFSGAYSN